VLDKIFQHQNYETKLYQMWEEKAYFTPKIDKSKKPYSIILPLPNANDPMHMGHALFTVQDILVRYHRMKGDPTLWLPGGDHAGIETQFVFEKHLAKKGQSRFDFDRETLYQMIADFVEENKNVNKNQMKKLGFSLDWTRYHYSLEPKIVEMVFATFRSLHKDNLIYRDLRLVNYCTKCGTAFSELEINHTDREDNLFYLDYGSIKIATARPETIFADVAVAINPKDKRYKHLIGKNAVIPIINKEIPIIADEAIKIDFGTGALKVTPAHAREDYEIGKKNNLPIPSCIDLTGRLINVPEKYLGLRLNKAREIIVTDLQQSGKLVKIEALNHSVATCYRCKTTIEPMLIPQWYLKTKPLAKKAIKAVKDNKTKIMPLKRFEKMYFDWLNKIEDWNISRQIVWGPRIPVWYCGDCNPNLNISFLNSKKQKIAGEFGYLSKIYSIDEINKGLQSMIAPVNSSYQLENSKCQKCHGTNLIQETDTFDTWFLSGQWPINTLGFPNNPDFKYFYPTTVLDTLWDILFFWVARMMMLGIYRTGKVPFEVVHIHSRVVDNKGQKMSKSKGNVLNPLEMVEKYGTDALRFSLVYGIAPGSDIVASDDKVRAMRNFANKIWNVARFIMMNSENKTVTNYSNDLPGLTALDKTIIRKLNNLTKEVTNSLDKYRFSMAAESLYDFIWHEFADKYIENSKERIKNGDSTVLSVLYYTLANCLKLLHPFMPFVTEAIWQQIPNMKEGDLMVSSWPK